MKSAKYKLAFLAAVVSLSLFSAGSFAKDGETSSTSFHPGMLEGQNGRPPQGMNCDNVGGGRCLNDAVTWVYDKVKDAGKDAANQAEKNANNHTDQKINENNTSIQNNITNQSKLDREYTDKKAKEAENAASTHADKQAEQAEKNANNYTDSKITDTKNELNQNINNAKNEAITTSNNYTDSKISENNVVINKNIDNAKNEAITTSNNYTDNKYQQGINYTNKKYDQSIHYAQDAANQAENNANNYTDDKFNQLSLSSNQRFGQLDNKIDRVEKRANAGIAGVTAISSIPYVAEDTFSFGMALGHYRNSQAVATGIQYKPSPNTNVRVNASWNNGGDTNVGAGFAVGW